MRNATNNIKIQQKIFFHILRIGIHSVFAASSIPAHTFRLACISMHFTIFNWVQFHCVWYFQHSAVAVQPNTQSFVRLKNEFSIKIQLNMNRNGKLKQKTSTTDWKRRLSGARVYDSKQQWHSKFEMKCQWTNIVRTTTVAGTTSKRIVSILIANKFNNLNLHVCQHNSMGITASMLSIVRRVWYSECFVFANQCWKLQFDEGENMQSEKMCARLLTSSICWQRMWHAQCTRTNMQIADAQQITCHFRIVRLKLSSITYAGIIASFGLTRFGFDRSQFALFVCCFLHPFLHEPFLVFPYLSLLLPFFGFFHSSSANAINDIQYRCYLRLLCACVCVQNSSVSRFLIANKFFQILA